MEKYFVTYKQALALKQLGLITKFLGYFDNNGKLCANLLDVEFNEEDPTYKEDDFLVDAPLKSQVFDWFRMKYKISGEPTTYYRGDKVGYGWAIGGQTVPNYYSLLDISSYEEAEETCIDKLIEIVKDK